MAEQLIILDLDIDPSSKATSCLGLFSREAWRVSS